MTSSTAKTEPADHPDYPLSEGTHDPRTSTTGSRQPTALTRIAAIAPTLKEAELRVLQLLAAWAENTPLHAVRASSRAIATAANIARSKVVPALDALAARGLITTRQGSPTTAAAYLINLLETAFLGGPLPGPPPSPSETTPPLFDTEPVVPLGDHTGPLSGPPTTQNQPLPPPTPDLDSDYDKTNPTIDRVLRAKPTDFDRALIAEASLWLHTHMQKYGSKRYVIPPPPDVVAQVLTCGPWDAVQAVLTTLMKDYTAPGEKYVWYVTVMLQRLHGIRPEAVRTRREQLRAIKGGKASPSPEPPNPDFAHQLTRAVASHIRSL